MRITMRQRALAWALVPLAPGALAQTSAPQTFGDWSADAPGVTRRITPDDLPKPYASRAASNSASVRTRPADATPKAPPGFSVDLFASGFNGARSLRTAPNGDILLAESWEGRIRVLRVSPSGGPAEISTFSENLTGVFGLALWPPGPQPTFLYAAVPSGVVRFAYTPGDVKASGAPQWVARGLPGGGHALKDLVFSPDGQTMFVSVGSLSNVAEDAGGRPADLAAFEATRAVGAGWGREDGRAAVFAYRPDGGGRRLFATGLRNCSGMTIQPATGAPWCVVNERDGLGDDLPPDYATRVVAGAFYGWPWYYIGAHEDPRHRGARPDLRARVTTPDVLLQPHSAPLGIAFYDGAMFPADYRGDAFVALHGSWNRASRTGYKVVRLRFKDDKPTGAYEDFLTGFVIDGRSVWGRPVGVTVMKDGALLVSEDGGDTIWRVRYGEAR